MYFEIITTSTTGLPSCDRCSHWTGYYCRLNKYRYEKVSCDCYCRIS